MIHEGSQEGETHLIRSSNDCPAPPHHCTPYNKDLTLPMDRQSQRLHPKVGIEADILGPPQDIEYVSGLMCLILRDPKESFEVFKTLKH